MNNNNINSIVKDNAQLMCNIKNKGNERKRKNENANVTSNGSVTKHCKTNFYSILDCETDAQCDKNKLKKFQNHEKNLVEFIKNGLKINEFNIKEIKNKTSLFIISIEDYLIVKA